MADDTRKRIEAARLMREAATLLEESSKESGNAAQKILRRNYKNVLLLIEEKPQVLDKHFRKRSHQKQSGNVVVGSQCSTPCQHGHIDFAFYHRLCLLSYVISPESLMNREPITLHNLLMR